MQGCRGAEYAMHHCLAICFAFSKAKSPKDCVRVAATELNCTSFERVQNCELVLWQISSVCFRRRDEITKYSIRTGCIIAAGLEVP